MLDKPNLGPEQAAAAGTSDFAREGREIDVPLLRGLALGRKSSAEMQLLLDSDHGGSGSMFATANNNQMLALLLADLSVPDDRAAATFQRVMAHQIRLKTALGRSIGLKTAAMDYLENIERALKIRDEENHLTYSQLTQIAFTDQLTGLANYRAFTQRLREEVKRCERYGHLLSLVMVDLDHFKNFNDRYGHPAGNKALQQIARTLFAEVRDTDLLARYGGEEFALILPHTTKKEASALAERIRGRVEVLQLQIDGHAIDKLTLSVGVATLPRDAHDDEALLSSADQALYQAKLTGRNQVCVYKPATSAHFFFSPHSDFEPYSVMVIGDFNDWRADADPMILNTHGDYEVDIPLAQGRYHYKFVIDGKEYIPDPACALREADGFGSVNSVIVVK